MRIIGYIRGWFRNIFNKNISILSLVYDNCDISPKAVVYRHARLSESKVGDYSYIGKQTIMHGTTVGKFCSISDGCIIGLPGHSIKTISSSPIFSNVHNGTKASWVTKDLPSEPINVKLGNDVWVGYRAMILSNVVIGDGAVIAAGAVVVKDVPPYAIVGGVPAKIIKYRFSPDVIDKLQSLQFWDKTDEEIRKNIALFQKEDLTISDLENWTK